MVHFAIKRVAIEIFQKEGLKVLHLGLSPFADVLEDQEFKANKNWTTSHYFDRAHKDWCSIGYIDPNKGLEGTSGSIAAWRSRTTMPSTGFQACRVS